MRAPNHVSFTSNELSEKMQEHIQLYDKLF